MECVDINIANGFAIGADSEIAGLGSIGAGTVAAIDARALAEVGGVYVRHALALARGVGVVSAACARDNGERGAGAVGVDAGDLPPADEGAHEQIAAAAKVSLAEGELIDAEGMKALRSGDGRPRPVDPVLLPVLGVVGDGGGWKIEAGAEGTVVADVLGVGVVDVEAEAVERSAAER